LTFTVTLLRIPLLSPFTTSFGTETARNALILRMEAEGAMAYGECVTSLGPYYSYEDNETALHIIRDHLARLAKDGPSPGEFLERSSGVKGHNMAKASVEMMLWDLEAKRKRVPLVKLLGATKGYADVGISIGMDRPEVTLQKVEAAVGRGYRRVKLKVEKGKEYDIVKGVRDAFPDIELSADANSCFTLKDARSLKRLDRFGLVYLEQPLDHDDLIDHAKLAREITTPICLDESVSSVDKARQAMEIGAGSVFNIKPGRLGGLGNSLEVAKLARAAGWHVWVGGMLETGIGRAANVAFASLKVVDYPGDTSPNDRYFAKDIVGNPFVMSEGRIRPNGGPGIGIELDERAFRTAAAKTWKLD
jgi:O-succinylbenzoate synthase